MIRRFRVGRGRSEGVKDHVFCSCFRFGPRNDLLELDAAPGHVGNGPALDAMEVGDLVFAGQGEELAVAKAEGLFHEAVHDEVVGVSGF